MKTLSLIIYFQYALSWSAMNYFRTNFPVERV